LENMGQMINERKGSPLPAPVQGKRCKNGAAMGLWLVCPSAHRRMLKL